jgi:hypothetical protein
VAGRRLKAQGASPAIVFRDDVILYAIRLETLLIVVEVFRIHSPKGHPHHARTLGLGETEGIGVALVPALQVHGVAFAPCLVQPDDIEIVVDIAVEIDTLDFHMT